MSHFNINDFDNESNLSEEENAFGFSNISKLMQIEKVKYPNENFVNLSLDSFHASFSERKTEPSFQNINLDLKALYLQKEHERKSEPFSKSFLTKKRKRENNNNERNEEKNWEGEEQKEKAKTKRKIITKIIKIIGMVIVIIILEEKRKSQIIKKKRDIISLQKITL